MWLSWHKWQEQLNSLKEQFSIKENWWSDADQVTQNLVFPTNQSTLFQLLGRSLIGSGFLCIASAKPGRSQELGSFRERRIPSCLFSSCSEKIWVDIWFYKTYGFCSAAVDGQPGAYNTRLMLIRGCHSRAFSFIHPRHWKSASCKDGAPGFLPLLGLWAALQFSKKKPQLCTLWLPLPWRHMAAFLNGKGQNVCGLAPN